MTILLLHRPRNSSCLRLTGQGTLGNEFGINAPGWPSHTCKGFLQREYLKYLCEKGSHDVCDDHDGDDGEDGVDVAVDVDDFLLPLSLLSLLSERSERSKRSEKKTVKSRKKTYKTDLKR